MTGRKSFALLRAAVPKPKIKGKKDQMQTTAGAIASTVRSFTTITASVLLGALSCGCMAGPEIESEEEMVGEAQDALTDWNFFTRTTATNLTGLTIANASLETCFLSGVAGNLNEGDELGGVASHPSVARVSIVSGNYQLFAHGGAFTNQVNDPVFSNNSIKANATCIPVTAGRTNGSWTSLDTPHRITDLGTSLRQCFLSGVSGVSGVWNSATNFVRVVKVTTTDATHPMTGWYIEGNLPENPGGSDGSASAVCLDFPTGTEFVSGERTSTTEGGSTTTFIGIGLGATVKKGCGLTEIKGAFNVNSTADGILITPPTAAEGEASAWHMTVSNPKIGKWTCAQ
ncbi:hypothetical protein [Polyangium aurulentum]|uniref:hypothetical protein n=1 Tax=Polyangium aurulentum TaxID=2567896 RepID=UPI0010AEC9AC|nr:hypothetical protein [Polyangium aurulentum]UQA59843.1 hypothetical protein E8A73_004910 [Polyangium aurulentum]